ncbi:MAG TPA: GlcNAc-PI de-N-acetylase [Chloroflexus aurantiacus]|jgi:LmbE family N-acetylglucosaminyl deacetylase|uniref:LmbE family protein n=1 Tax=Chloroflexus aurantiacus (strain ATCC 29366 / DSM 635 / J-10-fl) TaxID=324602 RepID=A9WJ66_CHLAA|nr:MULTISPECIES: PIG-L family deacetylase [Chloroflexus]ABY34343.1 LmbE family protein [Chloroflexus aurantiacus J-10-fl]RMG48113.1 MAG: GlcNAc-PI de-N-acetylase [Chloroflexota bacterium]GIV95293.1 MAG: GlcNAc-PI de-N-acetylase [Chloroflexus sp.]HBW68584.1 GlcNAc-PI de-N-acetylase [Chloroflexus aurantiacus]
MIVSHLANLQRSYHHIVLSPHLDDAALSCGGSLAAAVAAGEPVLVVTICTATPPTDMQFSALAQQFHADWGLSPTMVMQTRCREEETALSILGADGVWVGALDAIYRMPEVYNSRAALFGEPAAGDPLFTTLHDLCHQLRHRFPHATVYAPLGVGNHVDHQLTCLAAATIEGPVMWYEDFPYVVRPGALEQRLDILDWPLRPLVRTIDERMTTRLAAITAYASQLAELSRSQLGHPIANGEAVDVMADAVRTYARQVAPPGTLYGERFWVRSGDCRYT